ncbi:hypothetical protein DZC72_01595 [Maribacter algicola]|uniref:Cadherin domain-containing protein n=1 Tax=Maribacter algicola TaxID=2498892 RepID=A0A426RK07_9FLAO|nr:hypothetical protein [Maribacter algicola]RRQ49345.1 hypothetical protein DZC72_01595 [Maribacter algicola]
MKKISFVFSILLLASCSKDSSTTPEENGNSLPSITLKSFSVDEHAPAGTSIGSVSSTDADGDTLTFTMESLNGLEINEVTGEITIGAGIVLDFEEIQSLPFTVSVFDGKSIVEQSFDLTINNIDEYTLLTAAEKEFIDYFQYLTLWKAPTHGAPLEFSSRWNEPIKLYLDGNFNNEFKSNVEAALEEYNEIFQNSDFNVSLVETLEESNAHLFYGQTSEVEAVWPDMFEIINGGTYSGYAMTSNNASVLSNARLWISNPATVLFKHELGHVLGFGHSDKCVAEKSFLCSSIALDNDFLEDEKVIMEFVYDNEFPAGLAAEDIQLYVANLIYLSK